MPKITKNKLRQIIKQEKSKLLNERAGHAVGLGFAGWEPQKNPDFAKAYGRGAKSVGHPHEVGQRRQGQRAIEEQPQRRELHRAHDDELALKDAYKALQEVLFEADKAMNVWLDSHHDVLDQAGELDDPNSLTIRMDDLRLGMKDLADEAYKRR